MKSVLERLHDKAHPIPFSGCLIWAGNCDRDGYGFINVDGKRRLTHRVAYTLAFGPPKNFVCHTCDIPSCINPLHLYDGTNSQNMQDRSRRGRANIATGERHGNHMLTYGQVKEMRAMRQRGSSLKQIADAFGVKTTGHVDLIVKNKLWRDQG